MREGSSPNGRDAVDPHSFEATQLREQFKRRDPRRLGERKRVEPGPADAGRAEQIEPTLKENPEDAC